MHKRLCIIKIKTFELADVQGLYFYNALRYCNFLWKLEEQKFPQNGMPNFRKFCARLKFWLMKNSS